MADVFVIAVLASLDAGLLAATVVLLGRPRPAHKLLAFLIGCMGLSIIFGLVIVFVLHGSKLVRHPDPSVSAAIEIAAGALLIVVALAVLLGRNVQWRPRRRHHEAQRPERETLSDRAVGHDSLWIAWAAGALYSAPGAYYLAGLALLVKLDEPIATDVVAIVGFNLVMFAFIELPLLGFLLKPERARAHGEAQRLDDPAQANADHLRRRGRRDLPAHHGAIRLTVNLGATVSADAAAGRSDVPQESARSPTLGPLDFELVVQRAVPQRSMGQRDQDRLQEPVTLLKRPGGDRAWPPDSNVARARTAEPVGFPPTVAGTGGSVMVRP